MMNIDQKLEGLKKIREVDAPDFLLTRIRQQLQSPDSSRAPVKWKWAFIATSIALLALNLTVLLKAGKVNESSALDTVISAMHLSTTNDIYHE